MNKRLVQLLGDGVEELWYFPTDVTDKEIKLLYKEYEDAEEDEYDSFDEYLDEVCPQMQGERIFVDEIYV